MSFQDLSHCCPSSIKTYLFPNNFLSFQTMLVYDADIYFRAISLSPFLKISTTFAVLHSAGIKPFSTPYGLAKCIWRDIIRSMNFYGSNFFTGSLINCHLMPVASRVPVRKCMKIRVLLERHNRDEVICCGTTHGNVYVLWNIVFLSWYP